MIGMREKGFTLIETMVAIAILAIVLTGTAGSLVGGLRGTHNAYMRDLATTAAAEMADRMRANSPGVNAGAYVWPAANNGTATSFGPAAVNCQANNCTSAQMAQDDLADWFTMLRTGELTSAQGRIQCIAGALPNCTMYQISVMWDARRSGVNGVNCSGDPAVDLTCYRETFLP